MRSQIISMQHISKRQIFLDWFIPLALLVGATAYIRATGLDVALQRHFYVDEVGWIGGVQGHWKFIKVYSVIPALAIAVGALVLYIASFRVVRLVEWRRATLFLTLVMVIAPGLIINAGFKKHWGRPRPLDLQEFNRDSAFVEVWSRPMPGEGASFPSGHASVAFYLFTPFFLVRRRSWLWAAFFLSLGLAYGALVGWGRMAQGAHFLSDILWAAGFVYLTALALSYVLSFDAAMTRGGESVQD